MSKAKILIILLFAAAFAVRFADVFRPINQPSWRESDLGGIARNFAAEGMDPLYPRVDWRGDGPGYAEMEFPVYPWLTAVSYKIFGVHDQIGRIWALLFSLGSMFFFFKLAREYLGLFESVIAFVFFAFSPLIVSTSTSIQPEGLMLLAYIGAVYFFVRWVRDGRNADFWPAVAMTALSLSAKATSAHIGIFFGVLLLQKYGRGGVIKTKVWLFGLLTLVPAALWYVHAKGLWLTYGNSLGVSNEYHWAGWDLFTDPEYITGILRIDINAVWLVFGVVVAAFAVWRGRREPSVRQALVWLASVFLFYIVAARTTSQDWATYYHVFSVPPAALLFGLGVKMLREYAREFADAYSTRGLALNLARIFVILLVAAAYLGVFRNEAKLVRANFTENHRVSPALTFAKDLQPMLEPNALILVSGGQCRGPKGHQVAYNASYMFYWLERKGWNICVEEQSIDKVRAFADKGARYFIAERKYTSLKPGFLDEVGRSYRRFAESAEFAAYDLTEAK